MTARRAFTLIEILTVLCVLGILTAIAVPRYNGFKDRAEAAAIAGDLRAISVALAVTLTDSSNWPGPSAIGVVPPALAPNLPNAFTFTKPYVQYEWMPLLDDGTQSVTAQLGVQGAMVPAATLPSTSGPAATTQPSFQPDYMALAYEEHLYRQAQEILAQLARGQDLSKYGWPAPTQTPGELYQQELYARAQQFLDSIAAEQGVSRSAMQMPAPAPPAAAQHGQQQAQQHSQSQNHNQAQNPGQNQPRPQSTAQTQTQAPLQTPTQAPQQAPTQSQPQTGPTQQQLEEFNLLRTLPQQDALKIARWLAQNQAVAQHPPTVQVFQQQQASITPGPASGNGGALDGGSGVTSPAMTTPPAPKRVAAIVVETPRAPLGEALRALYPDGVVVRISPTRWLVVIDSRVEQRP
jgi:prepilin-type N-terminal cleavage/methylation domain-containing protein